MPRRLGRPQPARRGMVPPTIVICSRRAVLGKKLLDGPAPVALGHTALIRVLEPHEGKVLGQSGERGSAGRGLFEKASRRVEIGRYVRPRRHLYLPPTFS